MRSLLLPVILLLAVAGLFAAKKVISPLTSASNEQIDIVATISLSEDEVAQKLGADPGKGIVLLEVRLTPKTDTPVQVSPDDFILLAHDDGERSKPFEPSEIAGQGALVVSNSADGTKVKSTRGTIGMGGIIGGGGGASPGNSKAVTLNSKMNPKSAGNDKLLQALEAKQFPEKESIQPVEGYLYFPLDGKHKLKNLAVLYRGPAGRLNLEFQH
ncbi:MAG: hypothetical protein JO145_10230 [Acidobacteriaceae bacterium]|nr:hypothetical protein [Acidobacteriaceae bacterium]